MRSQYGLIVVWVVVFTSIFIGAFFLKFGSWPTSDDPGDWADFATYLSGTVGVTAVVGTLFAIVRTLGQQQSLIDSQNDMLVKQDQQLELTQKQVDEEERRRQVELAYTSSFKIFPPLLDSLSKDLEQDLWPENRFEREIFEEIHKVGIRRGYRNYELITEFESYVSGVDALEDDDVFDFCERLFFKLDKVYCFLVDNIEIEDNLKDYFDIYLDGNFNPLVSYYFFIHCYHAYLIGCGQDEYAGQGVILLKLPSDYSGLNPTYEAWQKIGVKCKSQLK